MQIKKVGLDKIIITEYEYSRFFYALVIILMGSGSAIVADQNILFARILGSIFVLLGIYIILTTKFLTITINKTTNSMHAVTKSIIKKMDRLVELNQIEKIAYEEDFIQNSNNTTMYSMKFYLKDNTVLPVMFKARANTTINGMSLNFFKGKSSTGEMKELAAFLNVPYTETIAPGVMDIIKTAVKTAVETNTQKTIPEKSSTQTQNPPTTSSL